MHLRVWANKIITINKKRGNVLNVTSFFIPSFLEVLQGQEFYNT